MFCFLCFMSSSSNKLYFPLCNLEDRFFLFFLNSPWLRKVSRLGVESELQLLVYTTAMAMADPSCICDLHHSSWQHWMLSPWRKAKDWSCILMDSNQICYPWATTGTWRLSIWIASMRFKSFSPGRILSIFRTHLIRPGPWGILYF